MTRRSRKGGSVSLTKPEDVACRRQAIAAAKSAERRLEDTRAQWPEVRALADRLRTIRERNHFAETIEAVVVGRSNT